MRYYFLNFGRILFSILLFFVLTVGSAWRAHAQCPEASGVTVDFTDVTCNGAADGSITITVNDANGYTGDFTYSVFRNASAGITPFLYSTTTPDLSVVFTDLIPARYTIFINVSDPSCDPIIAPDVFIVQPAPLIASLDNVIPACTPGTGAIDISVSGGNGGYSYAWTGPTDPGNTEDPTGLDAGTYSVTVTDSKGCTIDILDIFVPVITEAIAGPNQVVCEPSASLAGNSYTVPGEIGTWTLISGSGTIVNPNLPTSSVTNLGVGDNVFEWFITDENGICPGSTDQVTISWFNLELSTPGDILLTCNGIADGTGSFGVTGGQAPFVFTVDANTTGATTSTSATSLDFSNAGPGTLTVSVTDANNCVQQQTITISEPQALIIDNVTSTNVLCAGDSDGSISVTASGGSGTLTYTLQPSLVSNTTGNFTGLVAGSYTVDVSDANGCGPVSTSTINITTPTPITIDNIATTDITCNSGADGQIEITATGGTGVLSYTLLPLAVTNTTGVFSGLLAGDYTVEVTDENGCGPTTSAPITISEPAGVTIDNIAFTDVTCTSADDGTISITASGGVAPYTFTLLPLNVSNSTGSFTGLAPGVYSVDITEDNGCGPVNTGDITITDPAPIVVDAPVATGVSCDGLSDGSITVSATGGTGILTYTIQPLGVSNTTGVFTALAAGDYTVDIIDENGCTVSTATTSVISPAAILIDNVDITDVSCPTGTDGEIEVQASGGTGALTYTLQPLAISNTTGVFTGLAGGTYSVDVTDENGCGPETATDLIINEPDLNIVVADEAICNPTSSNIVVTLDNPVNGAMFEIQTLGGASLTPPVQQAGPAGPIDLVINAANAPLVTTTYQIVVTLPSCAPVILADQLIITVIDAPSEALAVSDDEVCEGENTDANFVISGSENGVQYELQQTDGTPLSPPVTATGTGGDITLTLPQTSLPAASTTYQVFATTGGGCDAILIDQPTLTVNPLPDATLAGDATICPGESTILTATLTGAGPWNITYSDGVSETTIVANASPFDIVVSPLANTTYSLVSVEEIATGCINNTLTSSVNVAIAPVAGDEITYGAGDWIGYVYDDSNDPSPYTGRVDFNTTKYRGFINQPQNFDLNIGTGLLTGPDLCTDYGDNYSIRFKLNADFVPGTYEITVGGDDGFRLSLDGGNTFVIDEWQDQLYVTETIQLCLDGNYDLVLEYYENTGESRVSFNSTLLSPAEVLQVSVDADQLPVCVGDAATFNATVTNGGASPTYQWQVNGANVPGETSDVFTSTLLNDGDIIRVIVTADPSATCITGSPATSNELTFTSTTALTASVSISADQNPACTGNDITFTALPSDAGANPTYQWQVNGVDVAGEVSNVFVASALVDGDLVRVILTPDPAVSCVTNASATSNDIEADFVSDLTATVVISADQNPVCDGETITFTATVSDAGATPTYQWQVNGVDVPGETAQTFASSTLDDSDVVRVIVTADPAATCVNNSPVTSNEIIVAETASTVMTASIAADQNPVCQGDAVTFTATVNGGGASPTYQWQLNGADILGETSDTYVSSALNDGDEVNVVVTADPSVTCVVNSPVTSNTILLDITDALTPDVVISADQNPACTGATINFTATVTDAGATPTYQWQVNGADVAGETGASFTATSLVDGDQVQVLIAADPTLTCVSSSEAASNIITMSLVDSLTPQVTITADQDPSCNGDAVTFTASFTEAGASPSFQWRINGIDVSGETGIQFTDAGLVDGDIVSVELTADPSATCVTTVTAISNDITINRVGSLTPQVDINASQTTICTGTEVLFTAVTTDAGPAPTYQWRVNGLDVTGETNETFSTTSLNDGDQVSVTVFVDPAISCATVSSVTSADITISVATDITPSVTIVSDQTVACVGSDITFTATPEDAGVNPTYQWQVNGLAVVGETADVFTTNTLSDGDQVEVVLTVDPSLTCATPSSVTSNQIIISIVNSLTPQVSVSADQNPVCIGDAVTWTASPSQAGANPTYQWLVNGVEVAGETNVTFTSSSLTDGDLISVELTVDPMATCASTSTATSLEVEQEVVNSLTATVDITSSQTTICPGNQVIFTSNVSNAGPSPTYQWQINGSPVAGATSDQFVTNALVDGDQVNLVVTVDPAVSCASTPSVASATVDMSVRPVGDPACVGGGENCGAFVITVTPVRPLCTDPDAGALSFEITGGSGSYSVVLSDTNGFSQGETGISGGTILFEDLTASDYQYTVTDSNGTTCTLPFTLDNETIIEAAILNVTDVTCFDAPDGTVTIEVLSGGNAPYEYSLDGILWRQTTTSVFTVENLSPQDSPVGILIRDDASDLCPEEVMVDINNLNPEITADISTTPVLTCDGNEGTLTVAFPPVGGDSPANTWSIAFAEGNNPPSAFDPFGSDRTFSDLVAGEYTIFIQDESGCIKEIPANVAAPNQVQMIAAVNPADCSADGKSGELNLQVTNSAQVPGPYDLNIVSLTGGDAGEVIYNDPDWNGSFISFDTLISATYEITVTPADTDLCALTLEREITGGPQPVFFDYALRCAPLSSNKELFLTNIQGNDGEVYRLQVFDNLTSALVQEITFTLNIGNQFLISNYLFLTQTREYKLRLVQSPAICAGADIKYDHPENLVIPEQLMAQVGVSTKSLPDRATGTIEIINFTGGYQPDNNSFPYLTYIEMDSSAVSGQSFSAGFDTVRLNQNFDFSILYEEVPAGRYRILVADQLGCTRELIGRVPLDTDIFIPNIFTPNGDGSNETFFIRNKPDSGVKIVITNRWGKQVFSSGDYQNNWDGGEEADGIYYYQIEAGENSFKGWVEILRGTRP